MSSESPPEKASSGVKNKNLKLLKEDHLYHIGFNTKEHDLKEEFGNVKFVCFGGQPSRMEEFAQKIVMVLGVDKKEYAGNRDRYTVYKSGPVLSVSHGIGNPSLSIVFEEIVKLLHYAGCEDVTFFRIGTSGGLGLDAGTVVISDAVVNGVMESVYTNHVLGKTVNRPAVVDRTLVQELLDCSQDGDKFKTVNGKTLCADTFYEGAVCCVTLLDRLEGDGITTDGELLKEWQTYPQEIVSRYIRKKSQS